jgi:hypothetical protein
VLRSIIDATEQRVLQRDLATGLLEPLVARGQKLGDRGVLGPGDELAPELVGGRVEREGERHRDFQLLGELLDRLGEADGRDRDLAARDARGPEGGQDAHGAGHVLEVGERLAHPHEHDVGDAPDLGKLPEPPDLFHDPSRGEIAIEPAQARGAEAASHGAPDLGADARGLAVLRRDHHALGLTRRVGVGGVVEDRQRGAIRGRRGIVTPLDQQLLHAVGGGLVGDRVAGEKGHLRRQEVTVALGEVGHLLGVDDALLVDPFKDLLGPELGETLGLEPCAEGVGRVLEDVVGGVAHVRVDYKRTGMRKGPRLGGGALGHLDDRENPDFSSRGSCPGVPGGITGRSWWSRP